MEKTIEVGRSEVATLCDYFKTNRERFVAPGTKEAHIRQNLIDPLFEGLGWDVANRARIAPQYREVVPEDSIDVDGRQRAPDYAFRVGTLSKFFVEAKKCGVNIETDPRWAYQLRHYGWNAKVGVSILTDFEELAVYDCTKRPKESDRATRSRLLFFRFDEYVDRWAELWNIFSYEAVWSGKFDEYAASKRKRGTSEVDAEFLKEIERWREALARNLALRNKELSAENLNASIQSTIDRIVFLRMAEDRGLEPYEQLLKLCERDDIYARFMRDLCRKADDKYNSGLFHFHKEDGVAEPPDRITPRLVIDDKIFKPILQNLYFEYGSPYNFSILPVEILGTVYERFLGKVVRLTSGHQAKIEKKPEVRKAGGVYYTPAYIVEYIVAHTLGNQIESQSPAKLAGTKKKAPFRVLDMACGSGSFLLGAYQYLLDYFLKWYLSNEPESHKRAVYRGPKSEWRLSIAEKKRILTTHIYGVDIDPQAVEVSKLSLLLKALQGENDVTLSMQMKLFEKQRALPNLAQNIKCGNSLIGPEYFNSRLIVDEDEMHRINSFEWKKEFADATNAGGFDCIIGNPPWGATLTDGELEYLRCRHKRVVARMVDSYIYFTDQAIRLTKENGRIGLIIPATLLNQVDTAPLRKLLLDRGLDVLVNMGQGVFGSKVLNTSSIIVSGKDGDSIVVGDLTSIGKEARSVAIRTVLKTAYRDWKAAVEADPHRTFFTGDKSEARILDRLRKNLPTLADSVDGKIQRGVSPDVVGAHVVTAREARKQKLERKLLRPSISGKQVKRYTPWASDQFIIYTTRKTRIDDYPQCYEYLKSFKSQNTCKEVNEKKHPWWALHRPRASHIFSSPKIIGLTTTRRIELVFDETESLFVTDAMYVFKPLPEINPKALIGVMQSKLFHFLYRVANMGEARVIPQIKATKLVTLPVPDLRGKDELAPLVEQLMTLGKQREAAKSPRAVAAISRQFEATDGSIDRLVYQLYGLSTDEVALVESAS